MATLPPSEPQGKEEKKAPKRAPKAVPPAGTTPSLADFIESVTGPRDNWEDSASITEVGGLLVVRNTSAVHERIKEVLTCIRHVKKEGVFANFNPPSPAMGKE